VITCRQLDVDGNKTCGLTLCFTTQVYELPTAPFPCNYTRRAVWPNSPVSFLLLPSSVFLVSDTKVER